LENEHVEENDAEGTLENDAQEVV
jgi:hypothetical protein